MTPLRHEHFKILSRLIEHGGELPSDDCNKLGLGRHVPVLTRRGFARWIRPSPDNGGKAVALRITEDGRIAKHQFEKDMTP